MADWNVPINTSTYSQVLDLLRAMSIDAGTLFLANPTNHPTGSMRWNRSNNQFEEWSGSAWNPKVLSIAGGGTGSSTAGGSRAALGLGTMSVQNANAVAIVGGNLSGISFSGSIPFAGPVSITASPATQALTIQGVPSTWTCWFVGGGAPSYGLLVRAGTGNASEQALLIQNQVGTTNGFVINGAMTVSIPTRLIIPVGANFWA